MSSNASPVFSEAQRAGSNSLDDDIDHDFFQDSSALDDFFNQLNADQANRQGFWEYNTPQPQAVQEPVFPVEPSIDRNPEDQPSYDLFAGGYPSIGQFYQNQNQISRGQTAHALEDHDLSRSDGVLNMQQYTNQMGSGATLQLSDGMVSSQEFGGETVVKEEPPAWENAVPQTQQTIVSTDRDQLSLDQSPVEHQTQHGEYRTDAATLANSTATNVTAMQSDSMYMGNEVSPVNNAPLEGLLFANSKQAKQALARRQIPYDWTPDRSDVTIPLDQMSRNEYVLSLIAAFKDIENSQDSRQDRTNDSIWAKISQGRFHTISKGVETVCWKLLDIAVKLHVEGPSSLHIFDSFKFKTARKSRNLTFEQRIGYMCDLLKLSKARCGRLLNFEDLDMFVAAPLQKMNLAKMNKKQNLARQVQLVRGRQRLKDAKLRSRNEADSIVSRSSVETVSTGNGVRHVVHVNATQPPPQVVQEDYVVPNGGYDHIPLNQVQPPSAMQSLDNTRYHAPSDQSQSTHLVQTPDIIESSDAVFSQAYPLQTIHTSDFSYNPVTVAQVRSPQEDQPIDFSFSDAHVDQSLHAIQQFNFRYDQGSFSTAQPVYETYTTTQQAQYNFRANTSTSKRSFDELAEDEPRPTKRRRVHNTT